MARSLVEAGIQAPGSGRVGGASSAVAAAMAMDAALLFAELEAGDVGDEEAPEDDIDSDSEEEGDDNE
jgi:hypothetical protein